MRRLITAILMICMMAISVSAAELVINDQYNPDIHLNIQKTDKLYSVYQGFTPETDINVTGIKFNILNWTSAGDFYFGLSGSIGDPFAMSNTAFLEGGGSDPTGWVVVNFTEPVPLTAATQYFIVIIPFSNSQDAWLAYDDSPDNYVNGSCWKVEITEGMGWEYGAVVSCYENNSYPSADTSDLQVSLMYQGAPACTPNWECSGYGACLENDTQLCNAVTDTNLCGESYSGDYTEFEPQACDYCTPDWSCDLWGDCQTNDTRLCIAAVDGNVCGEEYTGDYSEFGTQACDYCTPSWSCTRWQNYCPAWHTKGCLLVTDSNGCFPQTNLPSDDFDGNFSAYTTTCGYNATYTTGDLRNETVDIFAAGAQETVHWARVLTMLSMILFMFYGIARLGLDKLGIWKIK